MFAPLSEAWYRIKSRFKRDELDIELTQELRAHAEFLEEEALAAGASPDDARQLVSARLGNITNIREATRERWSFGWLEALAQDTRYAFRFLRRSPGFTAVAVLSLGLGIGANATVFTVVDKLLFSAPAHVANASELYRINVKREHVGSSRAPFYSTFVCFPEFFALNAQARTFSKIAAYTVPERVRIGRGPTAQLIKESSVTANFFSVLGVKPARGRFLLPSDEADDENVAAAVISHGFWQRQFGGADSAIGAHFTSGDVPLVIVGIAPSGFTGAEVDAADAWVPLRAVATRRFGRNWKTRDDEGPIVLVRLNENVSTTAAETEAMVLVGRVVEPADLAKQKRTIALGSIVEARGPAAQLPAVKVSTRLVITAALVLLAACANLANLLLMRALTRRREMALRLAIGVSRTRLASQMLLESLIIAFGGAFLAVLAARWGGAALRQLVFPEMQWATGTMDVRVFAFAVLCGVAVACIATIAPAIRMTRADVGKELRSATFQVSGSTGRLRQSLMAVQVALSVLLIVGAAAFSKSLHEAYTFDMGIDVDRLVTVRFTYERDSVNDLSRLATLEEAARRVRGIAGIERVTVTGGLPLSSYTGLGIFIPERTLPKKTSTIYWSITPELQATLGLRLTRGRWIEPADVAAGKLSSVLISEAGAKQLWPGLDPIGRCVQFRPGPPCLPVVGVIRDVRPNSFHDDAKIVTMVGGAKPTVYGSFQGYVVIRVNSPDVMPSVIGASQRALLDIRTDLASLAVQPIAKALEWDYRPLRLGAYTFSSFALLTTVLATIGLYGILAFSVTQRTNEFGIRSALGAQARDLVTSVVREGVTVVAIGVALGMALSWYASTAIAALLFQSSARDLMPYAYAAIVLVAVALVASVLPSWRATRVDPAIALRAE